jgi:hypothetical protein
MSTATQYTYQQVRDNFQVALKKIKTGVLKNSPEDIAFIERLVTQHILANQLEPTEANFSEAFNALVNVLPWAVKPAKLIAQEQNARPATITSAQKSETEFGAKLRAGEKVDAQAKANEESVKQAKSLIAGYLPTKTTARGQVIDYADRALMQAEWSKALTQAIEKKRSNLQEHVKALAATIQKRYREREERSQR